MQHDEGLVKLTPDKKEEIIDVNTAPPNSSDPFISFARMIEEEFKGAVLIKKLLEYIFFVESRQKKYCR